MLITWLCVLCAALYNVCIERMKIMQPLNMMIMKVISLAVPIGREVIGKLTKSFESETGKYTIMIGVNNNAL